VAFSESFWVTIGAAAPVIGLTVVVSLPDVLRMMEDIHRPVITAHRPPGPAVTRVWRRLIFLLFALASINLLLQVGSLAVALLSLAYQQNVISPKLLAVVEPAGLLLLVLTGAVTFRVRSTIAIYREGFAAGRKAGREAGLEAGRKAGRADSPRP
jgi:hypothetical protein